MKKLILTSALLSVLFLTGCSSGVPTDNPTAIAKTLGGKLVANICELKDASTVTQKYVDETKALADEYDKATGPKNEKNDWLVFSTESSALRDRAKALEPLIGVKFSAKDKANQAGQCTFVTNSYKQEFDALK